jgi:hypothetical protein
MQTVLALFRKRVSLLTVLEHSGEVGEVSDPRLSGRRARRGVGQLWTAGRDDGFMPASTASGSAAPLGNRSAKTMIARLTDGPHATENSKIKQTQIPSYAQEK